MIEVLAELLEEWSDVQEILARLQIVFGFVVSSKSELARFFEVQKRFFTSSNAEITGKIDPSKL